MKANINLVVAPAVLLLKQMVSDKRDPRGQSDCLSIYLSMQDFCHMSNNDRVVCSTVVGALVSYCSYIATYKKYNANKQAKHQEILFAFVPSRCQASQTNSFFIWIFNKKTVVIKYLIIHTCCNQIR